MVPIDSHIGLCASHVEPCAAASYFPAFKESAIDMIRAQGGIVGWTADSAAIEAALAAA